MRRHATIFAAILFGVGVIVLLTPARTALSALLAGPEAPTADAPEPGQVPELTPLQMAQSRQIVATDPSLRALLGGRGYAVKEIGAWTTEGTGELIGAGLVLGLQGPAAIQGDWPVIDYDETESTVPPYRARSARFSADNVTELMVEVDLRTGQVVSIGPDSQATVTPPAGSNPTPPPSGSED